MEESTETLNGGVGRTLKDEITRDPGLKVCSVRLEGCKEGSGNLG